MVQQATEQMLLRILEIIEKEPGVRPSEINRRLGLAQSDSLRAALIRRGLVRKERRGAATHLYSTGSASR
jgi:Mn-dependent DtxR family transcriptional regulator